MPIVYVDDSELAGPKKKLDEGCKFIRKGVITDDPEPIRRFLGCGHRLLDAVIPSGGNLAHGDLPEFFPQI